MIKQTQLLTIILKIKKALISSSNSLGSNQYSDHSSTTGIGKELRKKINAKNYMIKKYIDPIRSLNNKMNIFIILFILVFGIQTFLTVYIFNNTKTYADVLAKNMNIPGAMAGAAFGIRLLSYSLMLGDMRYYGKYKGIIKGTLVYLDTVNFSSVSDYMDIEVSEKLTSPVGEYAFDTYESLTLADSYKKFLSNAKFCFNREPLRVNETLSDILYEPHFKYFIVNSKKDFELMFSQCKEVLYNKIIKLFDIVDVSVYAFQVVLIIFILCIAYITFIPLKELTNKITTNSFKMFKYITKESFEYIITDYEEKIETLCENLDIDKDITENNIKNEKKRSYTKIKLITSFTIIIVYVLISGFPIISLSSDIRKVLLISQKSIDRLPILKYMHLYTYEVINQDRSVFVVNEPQRILNDLIYKIEKIQDELKSGSYGGPTFDSYPFLNNVLKSNGCHRLSRVSGGTTCETMVYDNSYGFSEEIGTLPLNELISEYLYSVKNFLQDVESGDKYLHARLPFITKENMRIIYNLVTNDNFFKLQESLLENIFGDIQYINGELMDYTVNYISEKSDNIIIIILFGVFVFIVIDIFIFRKLFIDKIKEMKTLVSFLFLVPLQNITKLLYDILIK